MNDELAVKISDLRAAADVMQRGTAAIRAAVSGARGEVAALAAQIDPQTAPSFGQLAYSTRLTELVETLEGLSEQMARAAGDVEQAARWRGPALGVLWDRIDSRPRASARLNINAAPEQIAPQIAAYTLGSYISRTNRPLYDALLADKDALAEERANLDRLTSARETAAAESAALQDRLRVYGQQDAAQSPRIQALNQQISGYDEEIQATQARADTLERRIDGATARLIVINPADGADVYLIRTLENSQSAPHVLANTHDCVNYIASRVTIPGELAANAHLWDERAAELTHLGIRIGDQPLSGAILVMETDHPYADSRYGHVMLVEYVDSSGQPWVTDNNHSTPVRLSDLTDETTGDRIKYLYLPWNTRA